ncbi:hypothetical protein E6W39_03685 [Kitasatospora acidiphila]|uniref:Uncharacterized protein n=1 Tax=Kitasatospora acidiphila TaxID=2567942 RepID=A0A540VXL8_9ACTN|nr:hypothetical protein E6W39_03685 [Kitasatospora acidiphila]
MIASRGWLPAATALVGFSIVLVPAAAPASASPVRAVRVPLAQYRVLPEPSPADVARKELGDLNVSRWARCSTPARVDGRPRSPPCARTRSPRAPAVR